MNVRITPRDHPTRTDTYGGIVLVRCDGKFLYLDQVYPGHALLGPLTRLRLADVAEIALDDQAGEVG
jgi:hypothetical protein